MISYGDIINFQALRNYKVTGSMQTHYDWQEYLEVAEKCYNLNRKRKMTAISNMSKEELDNQKQYLINYFTDFLQSVNKLLNNNKIISIMERQRMDPTISVEDILKRYTTPNEHKSSCQTFLGCCKKGTNNMTSDLKKVLEEPTNNLFNNPLLNRLSIKTIKELFALTKDIIEKVREMSDEEFKWYLINDMQPSENELEILKSQGYEPPVDGFSK